MAKPETYFDPIDAALVRTKDRQWIDTGTGNQFIVLRISKETGAWSALINCAFVSPPQYDAHSGQPMP